MATEQDFLGTTLILSEATDGDDEARPFEHFLSAQYIPLVRFLKRRTSCAQDAEDAAQESFARLLRYRDTQPPSAWKPLLFRIAANVALDQSRKAQSNGYRHSVALEDVPQQALSDEHSSPYRTLIDQRRLQMVMQAIGNLPEKCRHVFVLSRFHHMTNQAIAERCGISVRMVEKQISKAMAACRMRVQEDE